MSEYLQKWLMPQNLRFEERINLRVTNQKRARTGSPDALPGGRNISFCQTKCLMKNCYFIRHIVTRLIRKGIGWGENVGIRGPPYRNCKKFWWCKSFLLILGRDARPPVLSRTSCYGTSTPARPAGRHLLLLKSPAGGDFFYFNFLCLFSKSWDPFAKIW